MALADFQHNRQSRLSKIDKVLAAVSDDDRATLEEWLNDPELSPFVLEGRVTRWALAEERPDFVVSDTTILRWRIRNGSS